MKRVVVAFVSLILLAASASAQQTKAEKKQCRYLTPTGSYFGAKICKTRKEWAAADGRHEDQVARAARNVTLEYSQGRGNLIAQ